MIRDANTDNVLNNGIFINISNNNRAPSHQAVSQFVSRAYFPGIYTRGRPLGNLSSPVLTQHREDTATVANPGNNRWN